MKGGQGESERAGEKEIKRRRERGKGAVGSSNRQWQDQEKCAGLKYKHVEQPESWDLIERVLKEPEKRWMDIYQSMLSLLKLFISIAGILFVIAGYVWWAAALILLFCIPLFVFSVKGGKINYQTTRDTSHYSRKY